MKTMDKKSTARPRVIHHGLSGMARLQASHVQHKQIGQILRNNTIQAKLTIGQPNDKYEQEADRVADQVMAMPDPKLQRQPEDEAEEETVQTKPLADQITPIVQRQEEPEEEEEPVQAKPKEGEILQRLCPECEQETAQRQEEPTEEDENLQAKPIGDKITPLVQRQAEPDEEEEPVQAKQEQDALQRQEELTEEELQTKPEAGKTPAVRGNLESSINNLNDSGGQPLDTDTRGFFEPRFGRDFSSVRLHTNTQANETARALNAKAYTKGRSIVFAKGEYSLASTEGKRLLGHELTHVVQQGAEKTIQRTPDIPPKLEELRKLFKAGKKNDAIKHMGTLSPDEVKEVLARREFKELAKRAFNDNQMFRAIKAMRGDLYPSLEWMFEEGTKWGKVKKIISLAPSGKKRVRSDNWMKNKFVKVCNDNQMAEAVDMLGGTLLQKFQWMNAEGSNWSLVKAKLKPVNDPENLALYADDDARKLFIKVCNYKTMAEAVDLLGGTLLQKFKWLKVKGSNWSLVKAKLKPVDDPENLALYADGDARKLFVKVCNHNQMAEAVDLLGGTLLQKYKWMRAEGSYWSLVKAKLKPVNDPENLALYADDDARKLFVKVCNHKQMAEAVDLIGGTLLQKFTWMKAEGSRWSLVKAKLKPANDPENLALYGSVEMKKFFVKICNDKTIIEATRLLGGTWTQKSEWMKAEGVTAPVAAEMRKMLGSKAKWVPSGAGSGNTFEVWASAPTEGKAPPLKSSTTINCWEMVLLAAYRKGVIDWNWWLLQLRLMSLACRNPIGVISYFSMAWPM
jgi:hypothetical protein